MVSLFEESNEIGGQLNFAKMIPGKEEFHGLLNYYKNEIKRLKIDLITDHKVKTTDLINFDEIIISLFVAGGDNSTITRSMFLALRDQIDPTIAAISTILIVISSGLLIIIQLIGNKENKKD